MRWIEQPKVAFAVTVFLGMLAGVAAKHAHTLQTKGRLPKWQIILGDFLILGMVYIVIQFINSIYRLDTSLAALLGGAMAMWGSDGLYSLINMFRDGFFAAAKQGLYAMLGVQPIKKSPIVDAEARVTRMYPITSLRGNPVDKDIPEDMQESLERMEQPKLPAPDQSKED